MRFPVLPLAMTGLAVGPLAVSPAVLSPALAADFTVSVEIPRLDVAEYHRPYVAIWLENKAAKSAQTLAVWYDVKLRNNEGTKWLKDMRQWWRTVGRELTMPADGLSSPTRQPGEHTLNFAPANLPAGDYELVVEAAREVGGRELLRLPIQWPPKAAGNAEAKGEHELGAVKLTYKP